MLQWKKIHEKFSISNNQTDNTTRRKWHYSLNRSETPITDNHRGNESHKNTRDLPVSRDSYTHRVKLWNSWDLTNHANSTEYIICSPKTTTTKQRIRFEIMKAYRSWCLSSARKRLVRNQCSPLIFDDADDGACWTGGHVEVTDHRGFTGRRVSSQRGSFSFFSCSSERKRKREREREREREGEREREREREEEHQQQGNVIFGSTRSCAVERNATRSRRKGAGTRNGAPSNTVVAEFLGPLPSYT